MVKEIVVRESKPPFLVNQRTPDMVLVGLWVRVLYSHSSALNAGEFLRSPRDLLRAGSSQCI